MATLRQACLIAVILLASTTAASGEEPHRSDQEPGTGESRDFSVLADMLANRDFLHRDSREQIQQLAAQVPEDRRVQLYYRFREDKTPIALGLNLLLPPFGSLAQRDFAGALVGGLLIAGGCATAFYGLVGMLFLDPAYESMLNGGIAVAVGGYAFLLIRPFWWASIWDGRLADSLLLPPEFPRKGSAASPNEATAQGRFGSVKVSLLRIEY